MCLSAEETETKANKSCCFFFFTTLLHLFVPRYSSVQCKTRPSSTYKTTITPIKPWIENQPRKRLSIKQLLLGSSSHSGYVALLSFVLAELANNQQYPKRQLLARSAALGPCSSKRNPFVPESNKVQNYSPLAAATWARQRLNRTQCIFQKRHSLMSAI